MSKLNKTTNMKPKDYMVGDWILSEHQFPMKVVSVGTDYLYADFEGNEGDVFEFYEKYIPKPIPLTPEILEKNGWRFIEGTDYSTFPTQSKWINQVVPFKLRVDGDRYYFDNRFNIIFVHELQHALRLCGLDELADNFKVE